MKTRRSIERMGPAAFERLESRFLLDAAPLGEPEVCDGKDEAAATPVVVEAPADPCLSGPVCGVDGRTYGASDDPPGAGHDTADLVEGLYRPESRDIDTLSQGDGDGELKLGPSADEDEIIFLKPEFNPYEQIDAEGDGHRPFVVGYFEDWHYSAGQEPVVAGTAMAAASGGATATLNGRGIDLNEDAMVDSLGGEPTAELASRPIIEDILGSTEDFEDEGPADTPVVPQERPILEVVLGSTGDYEYSGEHEEPVVPQVRTCTCMCPRNLIAEVMGLSGGAGHCKIMAVRVANPAQGFATGGPLGAVMGGVGSILGGGGGIGKMLGPF
jgi:hypothetical protein